VVLKDFRKDYHGRIRVVQRYRRKELVDLLRNHHIKLFPTLSEGFPVSLPEAMACGLAPVVTATPGPGDIVRDGIDGLVVRPRDPAALANAVRSLLDERPLLDRLRRAAQQRARAFSWHAVSKETLDRYEELIERKRRSRGPLRHRFVVGQATAIRHSNVPPVERGRVPRGER
jgi:glycosyltransferase involved in cell wall biosynthesis